MDGKHFLFRNEPILALNDIDLLFLQLYYVSGSWSIVDFFEKLLQSLVCTLGFAFDLLLSAFAGHVLVACALEWFMVTYFVIGRVLDEARKAKAFRFGLSERS